MHTKGRKPRIVIGASLLGTLLVVTPAMQLISKASASTPKDYAETIGPGGGQTHSNYRNAGGLEGKSLVTSETIEVSCRVLGFKVQDGNRWWYRIQSAPWNGKFYISADAFYNDGATSGSLHGTPYFDPKVPICSR